MPRKLENLVNRRFGMLVVEELAEGPSMWRCICDCGGRSVARADNLKAGKSTSCGCQQGGKTREERMKSRLIRFPGILVFVARDRGPSDLHTCAGCGKTRAKHWMNPGSCDDAQATKVDYITYNWCRHPEHWLPVCHRCSSKYTQSDHYGNL